MLRRHGGDLHHPAPEVAAHQPQSALGGERPRHGAQDAVVKALRSPFTPGQPAIFEEGLLGIAMQASPHHGMHIVVQQAGVEQLAHQQRDTASGMEVIDVRRAVGIDAGQRRHHFGEVGHVLPGQLNARRLGDGRHVQGVVGRAAGGMQRNHGVDQHALVDQLAEGRVAAPLRREPRDLARRLDGQRIAQWRPGIDEGRARQVQAHHFHQHLIGVGGAIEGTGARAVIGLHLGSEQLVAASLAFGVTLAHRGLVLVGQAGGHRPGRHEQRRQMTEAQRTDQQARHDLVADAEQQRGVEQVVRQRHRRAHGDHLAAGNGQLHARLALGNAITHRRHAAGHLTHRADLAQRLAQALRVVLVGLVRREHVVVGGDDGHVGRIRQAQALLVLRATAGDTMGEVGALRRIAGRPGARDGANHGEIGLACRTAALDQALGDFDDPGMHETSKIVVFITNRSAL